MAEKQTTSIKIDPELWKEAKKHAIDRGITLTDLIQELLTKELNENKPKKR